MTAGNILILEHCFFKSQYNCICKPRLKKHWIFLSIKKKKILKKITQITIRFNVWLVSRKLLNIYILNGSFIWPERLKIYFFFKITTLHESTLLNLYQKSWDISTVKNKEKNNQDIRYGKSGPIVSSFSNSQTVTCLKVEHRNMLLSDEIFLCFDNIFTKIANMVTNIFRDGQK